MRREKTGKVCTIYLITNCITGEPYVGQTWSSIDARLYGHKKDADRGETRKLMNAIREYGIDHFSIEKIDETYSQGKADYWEDFYILAGDTINNGYNMRRGGSSGKLTEEQKQRISQSLRGQKQSKETREKRSKTMIENGLLRGINCPTAKLNEEQVRQIKTMLIANKLTQKEIANIYGIDRGCVSNIGSGKTWSHIKVEGGIISGNERITNRIRVKLTNKTLREIYKLYTAGNSIKNISKPLGLSSETIHYALFNNAYWTASEQRRIETEYEKPLQGSDIGNSKLTEKEVRQIKKLLVKGTKSRRTIAKQFNISPQTITNIANGTKWAHIKVSGIIPVRSCKRTAKLTAKKVLRIRERYSKGQTIATISRIHKLSQQMVCYIVHRKIWKHI